MKNVNANTANNILPLMANAYSKKFGIEVKMQGSVAYTNGKSITIPRLDMSNRTVVRLGIGYLAHEASHILFTDFNALKGDVSYDRFTLVNILEDSRVEKLMAKEGIGIYENFELLNNYSASAMKKFLSDLTSVNNNIEPLKIIYSYIQQRVLSVNNQYVNTDSYANEMGAYIQNHFGEQFYNTLNTLCDKIVNCNSTTDCIDLANEICDLLQKQNYPTPKNNNSEVSSQKATKSDNQEDDNHFEDHENNATFKNNVTLDIEGTPSYVKGINALYNSAKQGSESVTPIKNIKDIIEESSNSVNTTTREDFGAFKTERSEVGNANILNDVANCYGKRNRLAQVVRNYIETYSQSDFFGNKINPLKAQRYMCGETEYFKKKVIATGFSTNIQILIDVSSSMLSSDGTMETRAETANKVGLNLALALDNIDGVHTSVFHFPGVKSEVSLTKAYNEKTKSVVGRFDQKPRGSTPLAQALWCAEQNFVKDNENTRKIVFVLTDGMPDSISNAKEIMDKMENENIEIYAISIRSEIALKLFKKAVLVEEKGLLEDQVFKLFLDLFKVNQRKIDRMVA